MDLKTAMQFLQAIKGCTVASSTFNDYSIKDIDVSLNEHSPINSAAIMFNTTSDGIDIDSIRLGDLMNIDTVIRENKLCINVRNLIPFNMITTVKYREFVFTKPQEVNINPIRVMFKGVRVYNVKLTPEHTENVFSTRTKEDVLEATIKIRKEMRVDFPKDVEKYCLMPWVVADWNTLSGVLIFADEYTSTQCVIIDTEGRGSLDYVIMSLYTHKLTGAMYVKQSDYIDAWPEED